MLARLGCPKSSLGLANFGLAYSLTHLSTELHMYLIKALAIAIRTIAIAIAIAAKKAIEYCNMQ